MSSPKNVEVAPVPYGRMATKYSLLALYGFVASIVGVSTVAVVGGNVWEVVWPFLLTVAALLALFGVIRSKYTHHEGLEFWGTLSLIALLNSYTVAIVIRTLADGEPARLAVALLPVIISVTPFGRMLDIGRGKK